MKKLLFLVIGIAIFLIPTLLYILIPRPAFLSGLNSPNEWLTFWGSYLGGVFTALVGFITLNYSNRNHFLKTHIEYKQRYITQLEEKLAECVSAIDYSRINSFAMYLDKIEKGSREYYNVIHDLDTYCIELLKSYNSFGLKFYNTDDKSMKKEQSSFCTTFSRHASESISIITSVQQILIELTDKQNTKEHVNKLISLLIETSNKCTNLQENRKELFSLAQEWLKQEKQELYEMQNKLNPYK